MFAYEKREFKRRELEHELRHEDEMERAYWEVLVDGKSIGIEGRGHTRMMNAGYKVAQKPWNKNKKVTIRRMS
jgi:hypothetical protein